MVADELVQLDERRLVLEPVGEAAVQVCANGLREGVVGGVADEQVAEAEAVLAGELRSFGADQLVPDERCESWQHVGLVRGERLHGAAVEDLALDCSALEHRALLRLELVESRGQERPQRRRHLDLAAVGREREHLGDEERVAARPVGDPRPQILRQRVSDQRVRLVGRERLQPQRHRPGRAPLEQLRAGPCTGAAAARPPKQSRRLDEVEERLLAPLQVVEADDERRLLLEQLAERPGDLVRARRTVALAEQRPQRGRRLLVGGQRVELLDHLDDGPVGDPLAVGEAAPADDACLDAVERLRDQARLADARVADHRHELAGRLRQRPVPRLQKRRQLVRATDEARRVRALGRPRNREQPERRHRLRLPLQRQRLHRLRPRPRLARARASASPINTSPGCGRLLEARRDVDGVTGRQPLLGSRDDLAGVDADPAVDAELRERLPHLDRRPARSQRVVLVRRRHAEHRHHRVADELLDRAAVPLDDRLHPLEVAREQSAKRLGIRPLAQRRRTGDVAEEDGDDLANFARRSAGWNGAPHCGQNRKAASASCPQLMQVGTC